MSQSVFGIPYYKKLFFIALALAILSFSSCKKEGDGIMSGIIDYPSGFMNNDGMVAITRGFLYVILDDDTDVTNGAAALIAIDLQDITPGTKAINYQLETANLPGGKYYLLAGYDFEITDPNTDPDDPRLWEAIGWYGSTGTTAPASPNISDLSDSYNVTLYGLGK